MSSWRSILRLVTWSSNFGASCKSAAQTKLSEIYGPLTSGWSGGLAGCSLRVERCAQKNAYGIEIDQRWADRSGVSLNGDGLLGVFDGVEDGTFDIVVGNPPFGKMANFYAAMGEPARNLAERFPMWKGLGENRDSYPIELLFIERALQVLSPEGWGVLVLPEGVLANAKLQSARDHLLRDLILTEIVELPPSVFRGRGLNAKTAAIIFKKGQNCRSHTTRLYRPKTNVKQSEVSPFCSAGRSGQRGIAIDV